MIKSGASWERTCIVEERFYNSMSIKPSPSAPNNSWGPWVPFHSGCLLSSLGALSLRVPAVFPGCHFTQGACCLPWQQGRQDLENKTQGQLGVPAQCVGSLGFHVYDFHSISKRQRDSKEVTWVGTHLRPPRDRTSSSLPSDWQQFSFDAFISAVSWAPLPPPFFPLRWDGCGKVWNVLIKILLAGSQWVGWGLKRITWKRGEG